MEEIDIIPIKYNQPIPSYTKWFHIMFNFDDMPVGFVLDKIQREIERKYDKYDSLIIIKEGVVIGVI